MKHSSKYKKQTPQPQRLPTPAASTSPMRWLLVCIGVLLTAGATWAFMEFVVWNVLPPELVGKWEVVQGPPEYREAEFEFYRNGKMVGHLNENENLRIMNAQVRIDGNKIYITTTRPSTGEEHVSVQTIRTLNDKEFVVADERGAIMKMMRKR